MADKKLYYDKIYGLVMQCRKSGLSDKQWCINNAIAPMVLCQEKVQVKHELFTSIICLMPHLFPFVLVLPNISFRSH